MQTVYVILAAFAVSAAAGASNSKGGDGGKGGGKGGRECYDGALEMGSQNVSKHDIVNQVIELFFDETGKAIAENAGFKDFMQSRGACQIQDCMGEMVPVAVSTVYGKCGTSFMSEKCKALGVESLTGAFMACFPGAPREEVHTTVGHIVENMGQGPPKDNSHLFANNTACPKPASGFPKNDFKDAFEKAIGDVMQEHPDLMAFFANDALDCQGKCAETTIPLAATTLYQTDNGDHEQIVQAMTGAARACFPGQSRDELKALMTAAVSVLGRGAPQKLYSANMQVETTSLPMLAGAAALSLVMLFGIAGFRRGATVGTRMLYTPARQLLQTSDLEEDLRCEE